MAEESVLLGEKSKQSMLQSSQTFRNPRASAYVLINSCIYDLAHLGVRVLSCIGYDLLPRPV